MWRENFRQQREQFVSAFRWLVSGLRNAVGTKRMMWIAFQTFIGSAAVSAMGYSTMLLIRLSIPGAERSLSGLPIPDVSLPVLYAGIIVGGIVGGLMFYRAEREASLASVDFGASLRSDLVRRLSRPMTRGWQTAVADTPQKVVLQVGVADVRECTMAAREVIRLIGPVTVFLITIPLLFVIEPVTSAVLIPVGLVVALPVLAITRRVDSLNQTFVANQDSTRELVASSVAELLDSEPGEADLRGLASARLGDEVVHQRMLQPIRVRALTTITAALVVIIVLTLFLYQNEEGEFNILRFIVYLVTFRLGTNAMHKMGTALVAITRRAISIERYRGLVGSIENYRASRIERAEGLELPDSIRLKTEQQNDVVLRRGKTYVVLVPRLPKLSSAEDVLVAFEEAIDDVDGAVDLLGAALIRRGESNEPNQHFVSDRDSGIPVLPIEVVVQGDVEKVAIEATADFTFVVSHLPAAVVAKSLDEWDHLIGGILVVDDGQVIIGGSTKWARKSRENIQAALGRKPLPK